MSSYVRPAPLHSIKTEGRPAKAQAKLCLKENKIPHFHIAYKAQSTQQKHTPSSKLQPSPAFGNPQGTYVPAGHQAARSASK